MLDAIGLDAAVFEPEEVDVLTAAFNLAMRKVDRRNRADAATRSEVARLVHNLGRSRLKLNKRLRDASDAGSLAEEAADLLTYMRQAPEHAADPRKPPAPAKRSVPLFPVDYRVPPTTTLMPR